MGSPLVKLRPIRLEEGVAINVRYARARGRQLLKAERRGFGPTRDDIRMAAAWYIEAARQVLRERRRQAGRIAGLVPLDERPVEGGKWKQILAAFDQAREVPPAAPPATTSSTVRPLEEPHHGN